jgi:hypothetical protein
MLFLCLVCESSLFLKSLMIEKIRSQSQIPIAQIQKFLSNHIILLGFTTTFIICQKFHNVKTQKKIDKYHKNQEIHNLTKDITHNTQTIKRRAVNLIENENPIIIQMKNI